LLSNNFTVYTVIWSVWCHVWGNPFWSCWEGWGWCSRWGTLMV